MADSSADIIRNNGTEVAQNPQATDYTTSLSATESAGVVTVKVKDSGVDSSQIASGAVTLAKLAAGITPSHVVKYAGITASETDSDASVVATVSGVASTDVVVASILAQAGTASLLKTVPTTNTLTFTLSGNGGAGTRIQYAVFRAAA